MKFYVCLHYLGKEAFETVLSSQGLKDQKRPIVPKGRSPLTPLGTLDTPPPKLAPPLHVNQYVTSSPPHPLSCQLYKSSGQRVGRAWCSYLSGHPGPHYPCTCHLGLWLPLPSPPLPCFTLNLCLSTLYPHIN